MDLSKYVNVGDKIDLYVNGEQSKSQIDDIVSNDTMIVAHPMKKMSYIRVTANDNLNIICSKESGVFSFTGVLEQRITDNDMFQLIIKVTSGPQKVQRRDFFRLPISVKIGIIVSQELPTEKSEFIYTVTKDISAGGVCIRFNKPIDLATDLYCKFKIDEGDDIVLKANVVRAEEVNEPQGKYNLGIKFCDYDEKTKQRIIRFIFDGQIKLQYAKN